MDLGHSSDCLPTKMSPSDTDSSVSASSQKCEASAVSEAASRTVISDNKLQTQSFLDSNTLLENQREFVSINSDLKVLSVDCSENSVNKKKVASDGKQVENIMSVQISCTSRDCAEVAGELNIGSDNTDESDLVFQTNVDTSAPFLVSEICTLESKDLGKLAYHVFIQNIIK